MTPAQIKEARALVACRGWRWMPGMAQSDPRMPHLWQRRIGDECIPYRPDFLPDLTDPATVGCLLQIWHDSKRTHTTPCDVGTYLSLYGITDPRTVKAILADLDAA